MPFPLSYLYDNLLEEFESATIMDDGTLVIFVYNHCYDSNVDCQFYFINFYVDLLSKYKVYIMLSCMHGLLYNLIANKESLVQLDAFHKSGLYFVRIRITEFWSP